MALFSECMLECARKVLDTADIVRDAWFRHLSDESVDLSCYLRCPKSVVSRSFRLKTMSANKQREDSFGTNCL
jgi:hypothetical protein